MILTKQNINAPEIAPVLPFPITFRTQDVPEPSQTWLGEGMCFGYLFLSQSELECFVRCSFSHYTLS